MFMEESLPSVLLWKWVSLSMEGVSSFLKGCHRVWKGCQDCGRHISGYKRSVMLMEGVSDCETYISGCGRNILRYVRGAMSN